MTRPLSSERSEAWIDFPDESVTFKPEYVAYVCPDLPKSMALPAGLALTPDIGTSITTGPVLRGRWTISYDCSTPDWVRRNVSLVSPLPYVMDRAERTVSGPTDSMEPARPINPRPTFITKPGSDSRTPAEEYKAANG
jgi:hypothetical protein